MKLPERGDRERLVGKDVDDPGGAEIDPACPERTDARELEQALRSFDRTSVADRDGVELAIEGRLRDPMETL